MDQTPLGIRRRSNASSTPLTQAELPSILTMVDIARFLRIGRSAAYELARRPDFPAIRLGRSIRVRREAFLAWVVGREREEKFPAGANL
ncbi:MAG: helix-turn-helix domain-containing protein [Moorellales bacterium]